MSVRRSAHTTASPIASQALVDESRAALERLAASSPEGQVAYESIEQLLQSWGVTTLTIGVAGGEAGRIELFDLLSGGVLAGITRSADAPPIHLLRGPTTRFRAAHTDGTVEQRTLPTRRRTTDSEQEAALVERADAASLDHARRSAESETAERALPAVIRTRPPLWAVWQWLHRWFLVLTRRDRRDARTAATAALAAAEREVAAADRALAEHRARGAEPARLYRERLRELCSGGAAAATVRRIELEVSDTALPDGVIVIEATDTEAGHRIDRVIEVADHAIHVDGAGGEPRRIGTIELAAGQLPALATNGRAARIGHHAIATIRESMRALEEMLDGVEADYRGRVERLEALRVADPTRVRTTQLARIASQINSSVNAIMEHAQAHLGSELSQLSTRWGGLIKGATSGDELKAAATRIDDEWTQEVTRVVEEVRLLVMGGLGGSARDLQAEVVAPLRAHGMPEEHLAPPRAAPALPPVELLPTLAGAGKTKLGVGNWLSSLFRSLDTRRADVRDKFHQRMAHLTEIARAEMFDTEPRLHAALATTLGTAFDTAVRIQVAWLDAEFARERAAIERDRLAQAPLVELRDLARDDMRRLTELTVAVELGGAAE